jgi:hypothetical protein
MYDILNKGRVHNLFVSVLDSVWLNNHTISLTP